jgi:hypothetical protein
MVCSLYCHEIIYLLSVMSIPTASWVKYWFCSYMVNLSLVLFALQGTICLVLIQILQNWFYSSSLASFQLCFLMDVYFFHLDFFCSFCIFYCSAIFWQDWLSKASKWQVSTTWLQACYIKFTVLKFCFSSGISFILDFDGRTVYLKTVVKLNTLIHEKLLDECFLGNNIGLRCEVMKVFCFW